MFQRALGIALFLVLVSNTGHTKEIPKPPLSIKGMTQFSQRMYLSGLADGFQIVNAKLIRQGKDPLYCIPEKVVLYGRDLLEFASKDLTGPQDDMSIAVSGLFGLIEKYPCKTEPGSQVEHSSNPEVLPANDETEH